jgi:hypothetical protein
MRRAREQRVMLLFDLDRRCSVEYGMAEVLCGCKLLLNLDTYVRYLRMYFLLAKFV